MYARWVEKCGLMMAPSGVAAAGFRAPALVSLVLRRTPSHRSVTPSVFGGLLFLAPCSAGVQCQGLASSPTSAGASTGPQKGRAVPVCESSTPCRTNRKVPQCHLSRPSNAAPAAAQCSSSLTRQADQAQRGAASSGPPAAGPTAGLGWSRDGSWVMWMAGSPAAATTTPLVACWLLAVAYVSKRHVVQAWLQFLRF